MPHRRYPYFDIVVGLEWSNDPESYAGDIVATGRISLPGRSKVMAHSQTDTLVLQDGGYGTNQATKNESYEENGC